MKKTLIVILSLWMAVFAVNAKGKKNERQQTDREYWAALAYRMAAPVLENMAKGELQKNMQLELSPTWD
ncbi:MAG: hypothetical protein J6035_01725, partial [Bacteroidaceae bacterium]|nr:hypothetical protein [Bacteroidaceae bacterium]